MLAGFRLVWAGFVTSEVPTNSAGVLHELERLAKEQEDAYRLEEAQARPYT